MKWDEAGVYFTHVFSDAQKQGDVLHVDWYYQLGHSKSRNTWSLEPFRHETSDVWYTMYFDAENVTIYAGAKGFDESENAIVGTHKLRMTDEEIAFKGHAFLKIWGVNVSVHEISLMPMDAMNRGNGE